MIIYKTTNLINGKFYIGKDSKNDPNYLGSGKILKKAFKKYGIAATLACSGVGVNVAPAFRLRSRCLPINNTLSPL